MSQASGGFEINHPGNAGTSVCRCSVVGREFVISSARILKSNIKICQTGVLSLQNSSGGRRRQIDGQALVTAAVNLRAGNGVAISVINARSITPEIRAIRRAARFLQASSRR